MNNITIEKYSNGKIKKLILLYNDGVNPEKYIEEFDNNDSQVQQYKNGKTKVLGFLIGQVMKMTKGSANPKIVNNLIIKELNKK